MRVRLLGPVDAVVDGAARTVSGLRRKAILADPEPGNCYLDALSSSGTPATGLTFVAGFCG